MLGSCLYCKIPIAITCLQQCLLDDVCTTSNSQGAITACVVGQQLLICVEHGTLFLLLIKISQDPRQRNNSDTYMLGERTAANAIVGE
jgi:hypothetical protein